ncbi:alpha/beta hydrolase [Acinetobacter sichuanensis]|uniref:Alpha/beta hydrolase n=1 Tax=Acinetobacter sichuanensis TaxID=2136183 RepID=A0A371YJ64_9GAMM|nr:alpha/beta hydrolase [Acinetobacter sichuanensis]RFC81505.1 alpha/beta hydrolase [Acinetobacter sichuanensis]
MDLTQQRLSFYQRDNLTFDVIDSGPLDGKPFVMLHGFPETNEIWRETSEILNSHGYRTYAVNQRGYSLTAQPKKTSDYKSSLLVEDINTLLDIIGQSVYLVGHDWGAIIAWDIARKYPQKIKHLIAISVPHRAAVLRSMLTSNQIIKSYYIWLFQLPLISELLFEEFPKLSESLLRNTGMNAQQILDFRQRMIKEKRIHYAIKWYKALPYELNLKLMGNIKIPALFIWGKYDAAVSKRSVELNHRYMNSQYKEVILDENHWIPVQSYVLLTKHILDTI